MDNRTQEGYKLRVYMDAIKVAKAMTDKEWTDQYASQDSDGPYVSRTMWISYLESCALQESELLLGRIAA